MKKLLTVLIILVLGFAAIIFVLKQRENRSSLNESAVKTAATTTRKLEHLEATEPVASEDSTSSKVFTAEIKEKLEAIIPDMGGLEKVVVLPPLIDAVEKQKELPDIVVKMLEEKEVDLGEAEGETYRDKLNFYIEKYREEILEYLKSKQ